jgi:hypothetical protein
LKGLIFETENQMSPSVVGECRYMSSYIGAYKFVSQIHPVLDFNLQSFARILNECLKIWAISWHRRAHSIPNPFHILEQNLLPATVIKLGRSAVSVASDSLSGFKGTVIFQKISDAGRPERLRRIVRLAVRHALAAFLSMSAASVRTSGPRDNLPVLPKAAGNKAVLAKVSCVPVYQNPSDRDPLDRHRASAPTRG